MAYLKLKARWIDERAAAGKEELLLVTFDSLANLSHSRRHEPVK
jgi:hypothetical protein